ncbi:hypothetical protein CRV08_08685 [Halarcobacter ebronensis]|uniref:Uncharacterized protein n=1 Tax=Halarcobacter ebronensis TaxID=1462615 RepID=A0A4Q0YCZ7_9BACT|nr:hypothetical protein [Halarcobacter ebronensis]RXJ68317.1 hypothetical protein CRV08_08685 [Halarcobacter ebronensis]
MSKINPLYLLALIVILFITSFIVLQNKKEQLLIAEHDFNQKYALAKEFNLLKRNYRNKEQKISSIKSLENNATFKKGELHINESNTNISVSFKSEDPNILENFINRILQERFSFKSFSISLNKVTFEVEK